MTEIRDKLQSEFLRVAEKYVKAYCNVEKSKEFSWPVSLCFDIVISFEGHRCAFIFSDHFQRYSSADEKQFDPEWLIIWLLEKKIITTLYVIQSPLEITYVHVEDILYALSVHLPIFFEERGINNLIQLKTDVAFKKTEQIKDPILSYISCTFDYTLSNEDDDAKNDDDPGFSNVFFLNAYDDRYKKYPDYFTFYNYMISHPNLSIKEARDQFYVEYSEQTKRDL
ncbi:hypothetical protein [Leptospira wolffii]|uniref:hypothetical protein n=1 Tax=Leptospira wolffii TaxID=409998 RepID=UPI00035347C1|nr:hypothetical protein [Leptospira wolffii]EPG66437.1 hypothetical protein LEP1GSC061_1022 [Leptospira wolffii serovar Khorat str. Khorat-H2]